jgi:predicted CXXCH cytochrome family protein
MMWVNRIFVIVPAVVLLVQCHLVWAGAVRPAGKPTERTEHCTNDECHSTILNRKVMHGPVAQQKCEACHTYSEPREHAFQPAMGEALCTACHEMEHRTIVHEPVKKGDCTGCHDPHGSEQRMMLVADPARDLCLSCHVLPKGKFVHGPVASGACVLCHQPHSSWNRNLLVKKPEVLCNDCHAEVKLAGPGVHVHEALAQGCTTCHDAHASEQKYIVRQSSPALCADCHSSTTEAIAAAPVVHGAVQEEGGCSNCHSPHASTLPKLQRRIEPEQCLSCHDRPITVTAAGEQGAEAQGAGRVLTNMALLLEEHPDHHGPIREGACSSCHQPHAADHGSLLAQAYPPEFYAPFSIERYELCFNCHMPELVTNKSGRGLTGFRSGDLNLHWLHVNQEKGRTCRACHEVHASKNPFHMRDWVPFGTGGWMLEINFAVADDGGSCTPGCHGSVSYERGDVAQRPAAGPAEGGGR